MSGLSLGVVVFFFGHSALPNMPVATVEGPVVGAGLEMKRVAA